MKIRCYNKLRNARGQIAVYQLATEDGYRFAATAQQIKEEMRKGHYEFMNLQLSSDGRLIDKKETFEKSDKYYTVEDMLNGVPARGRKIKFLNYDGTILEGIGTTEIGLYGCLWDNVHVYVPKNDRLYSLKLLSKDDFYMANTELKALINNQRFLEKDTGCTLEALKAKYPEHADNIRRMSEEKHTRDVSQLTIKFYNSTKNKYRYGWYSELDFEATEKDREVARN